VRDQLHSQAAPLDRHIEIPEIAARRLEPFGSEAPGKVAFAAGDFHEARDGLLERRLVVFKQRKQLMADPVSEERLVKIAGVVPEMNVVFGGEFLQRGTVDFKQWPHNSYAAIGRRWGIRPHSGQSLGSSASKEAQEEEFGLVTSVMGEDNGRDAAPESCRGQEFVAQLARRHFDGLFEL